MLSFTAVLLASVVPQVYSQYCPLTSQVFPFPTDVSESLLVQNASALVNETLLEYIASPNDTALSVRVSTASTNVSLLDVQYTPTSFNTNGTSNVTGDTIFPIASVSKVFAVLGILQLQGEGKLHLDDSVLKYIPRLSNFKSTNDSINSVQWKDVTIDSLTTQLSGIGADLGDQDFDNDPAEDYEGLGLPVLPKSEQGTQCGSTPEQRPCTWDDFFQNFARKHPIFSPYKSVSYDNIAYDLLSRIIENITGMSYTKYMQLKVFNPANMTNTYVGPPPTSSDSFIPLEASWYGSGFGFSNATGGLYSTTNDLIKFGQAILTNGYLKPSATNFWLKPRSFTTSDGVFVGAPWEIAVANNLTMDTDRNIEFYTKSGSYYIPAPGGYYALLVLVPDFDLVFSVATAGPSSSLSLTTLIDPILQTIVEGLIPAIDNATRSEMEGIYSGTYTDSSTNSSITLTLDEGPGLLISGFQAYSTDVIAGYAALNLVNTSDVSIRLYPTDLTYTNETTGEIQESFRAVFATASPKEQSEEDSMVFFPQSTCQSWSGVDEQTYGLVSLDEFVITTKGGKASGVEARAWRVSMGK